MKANRYLDARREEARQFIEREGLAVRQSPGGVFHVTGKGMHVQVRDLADADLAAALREMTKFRKSERTART